MNNDTLKLTNVLADPTRFAIYQYILSLHRPVNVLEIAEKFNIHPNVARLHLTKLEDVQLLISEAEKSGKGGRPSRVYSLSKQVVNLQFPPRDYQLLADLAIKSILSLGEIGKNALIAMGRSFGINTAQTTMKKDEINTNSSIEDKINSAQNLLLQQGLQPQIEKTKEGYFRFSVHNCIFSHIAQTNPGIVCIMHHAMLQGILETYFGEIDLIQNKHMLEENHESCLYTVVKLPIE